MNNRSYIHLESLLDYWSMRDLIHIRKYSSNKIYGDFVESHCEYLLKNKLIKYDNENSLLGSGINLTIKGSWIMFRNSKTQIL